MNKKPSSAQGTQSPMAETNNDDTTWLVDRDRTEGPESTGEGPLCTKKLGRGGEILIGS